MAAVLTNRRNSIFTVIGTSLLAVLSGMIASQGISPLVLIEVGIILSPLVLLTTPEAMLTGSLAFGFIVAGLVQYFGRIDQIHWLVALLFLTMLARLPLVIFSQASVNEIRRFTLISVCLLSFCAMAILSIGVNASPPMQAIVGLKHYLLPLALTGLISFGRFTPNFWLKVWRWIPNLLLIQLPVVLYQYLFVATGRVNVSAAQGISWDAIVGTFGGNPDGGGASGALAFFLCFGIVATLALRRGMLISAAHAWGSIASAVLVIVLAEIKVVVVFLPVAVLAYRRREVFRSVPSAFGWVVGTGLFAPGLLALYSVIHWSQSGLHLNSLSDIFDYVFKAESDVRYSNRESGELSRSAALFMWWSEHVNSNDYVHALFGHGPAATKISATIGVGEVASLYQVHLNTSTLSALLWDIGFIGTTALLAALSAAVFVAFSNAKNLAAKSPALCAIYEGCGVGALLLIVDLPYNLDVMSNAAVQMTMATVFGIVLSTNRLNAQQQSLPP